jgi:hypothetical protein
MHRTSSILVVLVLVAATLVPTVRSDDAATVAVADQASGERASSAPIVLAQGRCFNGRCF